MAHLSKVFSFATNTEGWVFQSNSGGNVTGEYTDAQNQYSDTGGTGALRLFAGANAGLNSTNSFVWSGSFEGLGVPAGKKVTAVQAYVWYKPAVYDNQTLSSELGPFVMRQIAANGKPERFTTMNEAVIYNAATNAWTSISGGLNFFNPLSSNHPIEFILNCRTHNSTGSAIEVFLDRIEIHTYYNREAGQVVFI